MIINDLSAKTPETTGNEPAKPETFLEGLRKAFLQNQPQRPIFNEPQTTSNTAPMPENETPLIINDLSAKTPDTTGNEPAKPETFLEGLRKAFLQNQPHHPNFNEPQTTSNNAPISENETPLIINDLSTKTPKNTGNKPATSIDLQYAGYPRSSTPPDPTIPYTYYSAKMLITKYPDGRIRYDYGGGRPAITITKG